MSEWKECRLGDVCDLVAGYAFKSSDFGEYPCKVIRIGDIRPPFVDDDNATGVNTLNYNLHKLTKFEIKRGDFILAMTGATIGKIGLYVSAEKAYINQRVLLFRPNEHINRQFLYYALNVRSFTSYIINHVDSESAQPNISAGTIGKFTLSIPPLSEQKKIAAMLSSLDEKIETNRKINARLEELAQAIFKSWFIDFEPFGGKMPEEWDYRYVSDFPHEIETGKRPKGGVSGITEGIPSIGAESIKGIGYYDYSKTKYIPYEYAESLKKGRIQDFDLLIYKDGGKPGYFIPDFSMMGLGFPFKEMVLNEHVFRLNLVKPELNIFAYFYFKTDDVMNYLNSVGGKAAIPGINQKNVEDIKIIDLNVAKVTEFGTIVLPMFKTIFENCKESARLAALRDTLLPKLMSGELIPE